MSTEVSTAVWQLRKSLLFRWLCFHGSGFLNRRLNGFLFNPQEAMQERYSKRGTHRRVINLDRKTARKVGDHYSKNSYTRAIARACQQVGITPWTPNQLRHNCATRIRRQYGVEAARVLLGHSKIGTTEIYAEIDEKKSRQIMREVG